MMSMKQGTTMMMVTIMATHVMMVMLVVIGISEVITMSNDESRRNVVYGIHSTVRQRDGVVVFWSGAHDLKLAKINSRMRNTSYRLLHVE